MLASSFRLSIRKNCLQIASVVVLTLIVGCSHQLTQQITVSQRGDAQFSTVQDALNAVPPGNKKPIVIYIENGIYKEKLVLDSTRDFVKLIGQNKFLTILTYDDHTGKISPRGDTINTRTSYSFLIKGHNFAAENITFENSAGFTAGQAVAVEIQGDKAAFSNCRFVGNQDVLFTNSTGRQFYRDCYIEGTTDFIFGSATAWFERCHIHSKKNSHVTAASTDSTSRFGYIFYDCVLTSDSLLRNVSLGRPWRPYASVVYLHCYLDRHIIPAGWDNWRNAANEKTARFSEYQNYGPGASPSTRALWTRQLSAEEANMISLQTVFPGWNPHPMLSGNK